MILFLFSVYLGIAGSVLLVWCALFFRDPDRFSPLDEDLIVGPADGRICKIDREVPPPELELGDRPRTRVSTFMTIFNCHVNRVPADGQIRRISYRPGRFFNASLNKAGRHNERNALAIETHSGRQFAVVQIAGLVARRIVCGVSEGAVVKRGERFGMIRFGSRLDLYLPEGTTLLVAVGQTVRAGETPVARMAQGDSNRRADP